MRSKSKKSNQTPAKVRIIGGAWRGRQLPICNVDGLRPSGDRCRETLFNWVMTWVPGSHCLDLFAGTGALGFEALSRGANSATLIENHPGAAKQLEANARLLNANSIHIQKADALQYLADLQLQAQYSPSNKFDLVFIDPPFSQSLWQRTFALIAEANILADQAYLYVEMPSSKTLTPPPQWQLAKSKKMGAITMQLYYFDRKTQSSATDIPDRSKQS